MSAGAKREAMARKVERDFFGGSIRLHIIYHASHGAVFGAWLMEELEHHGYRLPPGTLYPILHALERNGYLKSRLQVIDGRRRRSYVATASGKYALQNSLPRITALLSELSGGRKQPLTAGDRGST